MHRNILFALSFVVAGCAMDLDDEHVGSVDEELSAPCGGFTVQGQIEIKYYALGGVHAGFLGCPTNNETATPPPRNQGRFNHFAGGGSIYWTPQTGAHEVHGLIRQKWQAKGWEQGVLGFPITDETPLSFGPGAFNHFQGGSIYWEHGRPQAFEVHGIIAAKWYASGWERGPMGYPTTDEIPTPNRPGAFNRFDHGSIYWKGGTPEAFMVQSDMRDSCWGPNGWENGVLGFPTEDTEHIGEFSQFQRFEHGSMLLDGTTGLCFRGP